MRKLFVLLLALVLCITPLSGCSAKDATVSHTHTDLTICLPSTFLDLSEETFARDYDFLYGLDPITVSGLRDEKARFVAYAPDLDLENYGMLVLQANGVSSSLYHTDNMLHATYEADGYIYVVTFWETKDAFWTVQAFCPKEDYQQVSAQIQQILCSVSV